MNSNLTRIKFLIFVVFALGANLTTRAQSLGESRIKAAYMVNFIKHITWPNEPSKTNFRLVIYRDRNFYQFISASLTDKSIKGKAIDVIFVRSIDAMKNVDLVYVPEQFNGYLHQIANVLRGSQTLLISDNSREKHDVMINLIHKDHSSVISFEVNKSNIVYEKLAMSSKLLLLGGSELDVAMLYRETEQAMQKTRQQDIDLKALLSKQQQQLTTSKNKLNLLNQDLNKNIKKTSQQKVELANLKTELIKKQQLLNKQEQKLQTISAEFAQTEKKTALLENVLAEKEQKNRQMQKHVKENKQILADQSRQLNQHRIQLEQQEEELVNRKQIINDQQTYILITTILIVIALLISILVVFFFIKNKKTTAKLSETLRSLESTQEQLIQAEKMASLGGLVAGVAHEINTPLSIAITSTSLVLDDTQEVKQKISNHCLTKSRMAKHIDKVEQSLSMSEKALERVKVLLANFKQVAVDQIVNDKRKLNLAKYIEEVMMTLSVEMKKHHVEYQFSGVNDLELSTLPGAFAQVLTNLVNNSIRHGFEGRESGKIMITLQVNDQHLNQNWLAKITYQDDGIGMSNEVLKNIFEPFFTTKRSEGNTGLGMNIVYNIINQKLKGHITITSEQNIGSTFVVTLPRAI